MIKKEGGKYVVKSEDGKRSFGSYKTRKEAVKRLGQVEYFKHRGYDDGGVESPTANDAETLAPIMKNSYSDEKKGIRKKAIKNYAEGGSKKKMPCNKPKRDTSGNKKTHVVKACQDGKEKIVRFGHKMPDGTKNPERRKSYCARSKGIGGTKNKLKANYWSRKNWDC